MHSSSFFARLARGLGALFVVAMTLFSQQGDFVAPQADAAWCTTAGTYYVDPAAGVDRGGCWGYDSAHAYKTAQAAIDYINSLYPSGPIANVTLRYAPNGGTEKINNATGIPYTIRPYTDYQTTTTTFDVVGQNLTFTKFKFTSGRISYHGTSNTAYVMDNQFVNAGYRAVEVTSKVTIQIENNTFDKSGIYVHDNASRVTIWTNTFKTSAPNYTLSCGSSCTMNYGNWYAFVMRDTAGGFDFVGNTVSGGQALYMEASTSAIVMSNTVTGTGATSDHAFHLFDTDAASVSGNTVSQVGTALYLQGWSKTLNVNYIDSNSFSVVNAAAVSVTGAKINEFHDNTIGGGTYGAAFASVTLTNFYNNTLSSSVKDTYFYMSTVQSIKNNRFASTKVGLDVMKTSTVAEINQNYFGSENSPSGIGLIMENENDSFTSAQKGEQVASTVVMNAGTLIVQNTFDRLALGIGMHYAAVNGIQRNTFQTVDNGMETYGSSSVNFQNNTLIADTTAATRTGVILHGSTLSTVRSNSFKDFTSGLVLANVSAVNAEFSRNLFNGGTYGIHITSGTISVPVTNCLFTSNAQAIVVDPSASTAFTVLFSTFYGQTATPIVIGDLTANNAVVSSNLFSGTVFPAVNVTTAADLVKLDYNLYDTTALGTNVVTVAGAAKSLLAAQAAGYETHGYEETITTLAANFVPVGNSLAVNSADPIFILANDLNGVARPVCMASDRGAVEAPGVMAPPFSTTDSDSDGLCRFQETAWGSSDSTADSDGDALDDQEEIYTYRTGVMISDTDGDSYTDGEEVNVYGTDPLDASSHPNDADRDHMDDTWETTYGLDPTDASDAATDLDSDGLSNVEEYVLGTDPTDADMDDDGLSDGDEVAAGTDWLNADSDADGMEDGWEVTYGLDPLAVDSAADADADGLSNYDEYDLGTSPVDADTDADGMDDYWENDNGLDPLVDDTSVDSDSDGLNNGDEYALGTEPDMDDTDGDGFEDGFEVSYGTDPLDAASYPIIVDDDADGMDDSWEDSYSCMDSTVDDSALDNDSDGLSNYEEYGYASNPCSDDTDADGMEDGYEVTYGLDLIVDDSTADADGDGLGNYEEYSLGTDPSDRDTDGDGAGDGTEQVAGTDPLDASDFPPDLDGDGMDDTWEASYSCMDALVSDASTDDDADGLTAFQEYGYGTNPCSADTDSDGMDDAWELSYGLSALVGNASDDADSDGMTDYQEYTAGTDPTDSDSDGDGMIDGWEYGYGLNPADASDATTDLDGDGLSNLDEYTLGTSPLSTDSDADGMDDGWEVTYTALDPTVYDATGDLDADGLDNLEEYTLGTDPTDSDSDDDAYSDGVEVSSGTNPLDSADHPSDMDGDSMDDAWEASYSCMDALVSDASTDDDADGLTALEEYGYGTDPCTADTDGDGYDDGMELSSSTDPLDAADYPMDADGDGLDATAEATAGTDPADSDTDDDGLSDGDEVLTYGTSPLTNDTDGDFYTDGYEISRGSSPTSSASMPTLTVTVLGYDDTYGYGSSGAWSYGTNPYTSTVSADVSYAGSYWFGAHYNGYGAFAVSYDTTAFLGTVTVYTCGTGTTAFDPTARGCSAIPTYASSTSPDTETTEVSSSSQLEAWSDLSAYYSFSDYRWFRPLVSSSDEYVGFRVRIGY